jgi:ankyrin repeat protein
MPAAPSLEPSSPARADTAAGATGMSHTSMEFRNVVFNAARDGKIRRLKVFLDHRPKDEIEQLVSAKTNGATPLVLSCRNGHREVVEYLVERCNADVEQAGSVTFDGETIEGAPPLWCAAAAGHTNIVRLLAESGANVNSTTKTNSTPLRAACFDGHYDIVQYLVERGADIEVANRHGHTCLMIACYKGHLRIAKYLIGIGANVNRKSVKGNTALHDCAESGSLEIMKLLLVSGANMDIDAYGMTPLLAAAVTGHMHIVEHLISKSEIVSRKARIDALELLGATFVDKKRDMLGSFKLWKRAMEERYCDGELVVPKVVVASPISAYENTLEVETLEQLEDIISDPDEMRMQALLVRERILGPAHPDTSYYIRYRGAVYADMGHFERCITLWMYALDMQQKMLEPLSPMTQSSLLSFAELFSFMMSEGRSRGANNANSNSNERQDQQPGALAGTPHPPVNFCDIMTVFEKAVMEVRAGQEAMKRNAGAAGDRDITYFNRTLIIILHLICLLTKLTSHLGPEQIFRVKKAVFNFLQLDPRGRNGSSLLHLACARDSSSVGRYPICQFPSLDAIRLLVECGADPNSRDADDSTCLHIAATNRPAKPPVVEALLEAGAHLDAVNAEGKAFSDLLKGQLLHHVVKPLKFTSLQCLAAQAIRKKSVEYRPRKISRTLETFVDLH